MATDWGFGVYDLIVYRKDAEFSQTLMHFYNLHHSWPTCTYHFQFFQTVLDTCTYAYPKVTDCIYWTETDTYDVIYTVGDIFATVIVLELQISSPLLLFSANIQHPPSLFYVSQPADTMCGMKLQLQPGCLLWSSLVHVCLCMFLRLCMCACPACVCLVAVRQVKVNCCDYVAVIEQGWCV